MTVPNFSHRPFPGGSKTRQAFSSGVSHLLQSINLPTRAWMEPRGQVDALFERWGVPWAADPAEVEAMSDVAGKMRDRISTLSYPDDDPEAVHWFDNVIRVDVPPALMGPTATVEISRAPVLGWGMSVLERMATWMRVLPVGEDGAAGPSLELANIAKLPVGTQGDFNGSPFPFPLLHPLDPTRLLSVRWALIFQQVPQMHGRTPSLLPPTAGTQILPAAQRWATWDDMRFGWENRYTIGNQMIFGGHGLLRLFAQVSVTGAGDPVNTWRVEVGGRLSGYTQRAGEQGYARADATQRH